MAFFVLFFCLCVERKKKSVEGMSCRRGSRERREEGILEWLNGFAWCGGFSGRGGGLAGKMQPLERLDWLFLCVPESRVSPPPVLASSYVYLFAVERKKRPPRGGFGWFKYEKDGASREDDRQICTFPRPPP